MLVRQLEVISCREGGDPGWVPTCLQVLELTWSKFGPIWSDLFTSCVQGVGVSVARLLDVYNRIYTAKDPVWLTSGDELHILKVIQQLALSSTNCSSP